MKVNITCAKYGGMNELLSANKSKAYDKKGSS